MYQPRGILITDGSLKPLPPTCPDHYLDRVCTVFVGVLADESWEYWASPDGKSVQSRAVREGCGSSSFGDLGYLRQSLTWTWMKTPMLLTPEGAALVGPHFVRASN